LQFGLKSRQLQYLIGGAENEEVHSYVQPADVDSAKSLCTPTGNILDFSSSHLHPSAYSRKNLGIKIQRFFAKQAASRVVSALVFTLYLLLHLVCTVQPCNSLKTKRFRSLSPGGAETTNGLCKVMVTLNVVFSVIHQIIQGDWLVTSGV
jgi:hypothetical protein